MDEQTQSLMVVPAPCSELVVADGHETTTSSSITTTKLPVSEPTTNALALYDFWRTVDRSNNEHYAAEIACFMQRPAIQTILDRIALSDDKDTSSSALVPFWPFGYVYAAWNPLFPDLIKIGATMRQKPYMRVAELSTSGVPEPFQLVDSIACKDPFALEKEIHAHYNAVRKYGKKKEFFILSREDILEYFHVMSFKATLLQPPRTGGDNHAKKQRRSETTGNQPGNVTSDPHENPTNELKDALKIFIDEHVIAENNAKISTRKIMDAFISHGYRVTKETLFWAELSTQLKEKFPNVKSKRSKYARGYIGISLC